MSESPDVWAAEARRQEREFRLECLKVAASFPPVFVPGHPVRSIVDIAGDLYDFVDSVKSKSTG